MDDFEIDFSQLDEWNKTLQKFEDDFPKESKKTMLKVGNEARKIVSKNARQLVKKDTGRYHKSIKRGKIFYQDGQLTVRVYSNAPHKFLIENGHRIVDKNGVEHGFKPGYKVFEKSEREIGDNFTKIVENELDKMFDKL